jgi:hypothetical protein
MYYLIQLKTYCRYESRIFHVNLQIKATMQMTPTYVNTSDD